MNRAAETSNDRHRIAELQAQVQELTRQLDWFECQLFGRKSEKRLLVDAAQQPLLDGLVDSASLTLVSVPTETVTYQRRKKQRDAACVTDEGLRFDDTVPVVTMTLPVPTDVSAHEVIGEQVTHRLAQLPGSYVVLKVVRLVVKRKLDAVVYSCPVPATLWPGSMADVSVVAGILTDKFCYHLPLYRHQQRMALCGVQVARATLTQCVHRACALLAPGYCQLTDI